MTDIKQDIYMFRVFVLIVTYTYIVCAYAQVDKQLFLKDLLGTQSIDYGITFTADQKTFYFARAEGVWGQKIKSTIYYASQTDGQWSELKVAPFSGVYDDSDPHISADGRRLYFVSDRPDQKATVSADIWMVEKNNISGWKAPVRLPEPINSTHMEASPKTTKNGDLYFVSNRKGTVGQGDIFRAAFKDDGIAEVQNLGETINASTGEWNFDINPEGNILIFEASHREENLSVSGDLYISFKNNSDWTSPQNIMELNSTGSDLYPELMNEGTLYYSSNGFHAGTSPKIYAVDVQRLIERYKKSAKLR